MDEVFIQNAQTYAVRHQLQLAERLGKSAHRPDAGAIQSVHRLATVETAMKNRWRKLRKGRGTFYAYDNQTGNSRSLHGRTCCNNRRAASVQLTNSCLMNWENGRLCTNL
jgi:hypothetical protein